MSQGPWKRFLGTVAIIAGAIVFIPISIANAFRAPWEKR